MKRFSVLLVVVAFLIPLVVYGLNGNFDRSNNDKGLELDSPNISIKSNQLLPSEDDPLPPDPTPEEQQQRTKHTLFPSPHGVKGIIDSIDLKKALIVLKNAVYTDPFTQLEMHSDFNIKLSDTTKYYNHMNLVPNTSHLSAGMEILCYGKINHVEKTVDPAEAVLTGKFFEQDSKIPIPFEGIVQQIDRANNQITVTADAFPDHILPDQFIIKIVPASYSYKVLQGQIFPEHIGRGLIPQDFNSGMTISGMAEISYGDNFCTALDIVFYFEHNN